jgi:O-antigen ligase
MAKTASGSQWLATRWLKLFPRMPSALFETRSIWSFRLALVCLVAVSVSLPIAWISLAKLLLFIVGLIYLMANPPGQRSDSALRELWMPKVVMAIMLMFAFSLLWTEVDLDAALSTLVKHSKLMTVLLLVCLIRNVQEARIAILAFVGGQTVLLLSSWLMAAGVPIPWAVPTAGKYVIFSSYLDQSIIFATTAAVFWHLRSDRLWPQWLGGLLAAAAMVNTLLLLAGRTGYAVAVTLLSLCAMWAMPKRLRLTTLVVTPIIVLLGLYLGSSQVQERLSKVLDEGQRYEVQTQTGSSSGWRLNAWTRSVQAIKESPWAGHGVGSWTQTIKRLEGPAANQIFGQGNASNPHQEYLLWGVELGVGGMLLLLLFMFSVMWDARPFTRSASRATVSVLAAMAVACLFNSSLYDGLIGDFFCTALGLLMALGIRSQATVWDQATS